MFKMSTDYMETLAIELKGKRCLSGEIKVIRGGILFTLYLFPSCGKVPGYLQIKTKMHKPGPRSYFEVRRNDVVDRIAETLCLNKDFQVGVGSFDSKVFITAEDEAWAKRILSKAEIRSFIVALLDDGFSKVISRDRELLVTRHMKHDQDYPSLSMINSGIDSLRQMLESL